MNKEEFVSTLKEIVIEGSINAVESNLIMPAGKQPPDRLVELSTWFNSLRSEDRVMVKKVVIESVGKSVFSFLSVLDGVNAIEPVADKGELVLKYHKDGFSTWLNNPDENHLHKLL